MYPDPSNLKSYETFLLSKCATCSISFKEGSPKATKLRILRNEKNSADYLELTNIEVFSFIFGMSTSKFTSNLISDLQDIITPEDYAEITAQLSFNNFSDITSWACLALCQSCAPKLAELYSAHKEFANNLALDSFVFKATIVDRANVNGPIQPCDSNIDILKIENDTCDVKLENENETFNSDSSDYENFPASPQSPPDYLQNDDENATNLVEENSVSDDKQDDKTKNTCDIQFTSDYASSVHKMEFNDASPQSPSSSNLQEDHEDTTNLAEKNLLSEDKQKDKSKNTSLPSRWLCKECDIQFTSDYASSVHKFEFHDSVRLDICREPVKGPPFCCPISPCDKKFAKQQGVKYHCLRKHRVKLLASNDSEKSTFCSICRFSFPTKLGLSLHRAHVHTERNKKELNQPVNSPERKKCHQCQSEFKSIQELQQHGLNSHVPKLFLNRMKVTTDAKVRCLQCQLNFDRMTDFNIHCEDQQKCSKSSNEDVSHNSDSSSEFLKTRARIINKTLSSSEKVQEINKTSRSSDSKKSAKVSKRVLNCDDISQDEQLELHTEVVKGPPYQCPKCSSYYKKLEILKVHCKKVHQLQLPIQRKVKYLNVPCSVCSTIFKNITALKNHNRMAHGLLFICTTCYKGFENETLLNIHSEGHDPDNRISNANSKESDPIRNTPQKTTTNVQKKTVNLDDQTFSCTYCDLGFTNGSEFETHVAEIHKKFKCCHCFRNFSSVQFREMHSKRHSVNFPNTRCEFCEKDFSNVGHMQKHQQHKHFQEMMLPEVREECHLCERWFRLKSNLNFHILNDHAFEKPYKCEKCDKSFADSRFLSSHVKRAHEREKRLKCPHCDMRFVYKRKYDLHIVGHGEERPFVCELCKKGFKRGYELKQHMVIHGPAVRKFFCEKCGSGFKRKNHFNAHMLKHADQEKEDGSFDCQICGVKLKHSFSLKLHLRLKHPADGKGKHFCKLCNQNFRDKGRFSRHIESKHSQENVPKCSKKQNKATKSGVQIQPSIEGENECGNIKSPSSSVFGLRPSTAESYQPSNYGAQNPNFIPLPAQDDTNLHYHPSTNYNMINDFSSPSPYL